MAEEIKQDDGIGAMTTLTVVILCCGTLFTLTNGGHGCCMGARRSVRLQFEKRQAAMQAAAEGKPYALPVTADDDEKAAD